MSEERACRDPRGPSRRGVLLACGAAATFVAVNLARDAEREPAALPLPPPPGPRAISVGATEPAGPLLPAATRESGGARVLGLVFSTLVGYDADGNARHEAAESIESADHRRFTVRLRPGQVFSDGSPVTASSFVDAWNDGASGDGRSSNPAFEPIEGYADVSADPPTATAMSGLAVVDATTFTIALTRPDADFRTRLGRPAFCPLPAGALDDVDGFGQDPVGNGPYRLAGRGAWRHDERIDLVPSEGYAGPRPPANGGLTLVMHASREAAWEDLLAGGVDVVDALPTGALAAPGPGAGSGVGTAGRPVAALEHLVVPAGLAHFSGEEGRLRRAAISRAIDRAGTVRDVLAGAATPAVDFTSPAVPGWRPDVAGHEVLTHDGGAARALWAAAEAISPYGGTFTIGYAVDGGHQGWVDATARQITDVLGVPARGEPYPILAALRTDVVDGALTGAYRSGRRAEHPSQQDLLVPVHTTGASDNDGGYSRPEVDALLAGSGAAPSARERDALLVRAQEVLLADLPVIPLWYPHATGGWCTARVSGVRLGWDGLPAYEEIVPA